MRLRKAIVCVCFVFVLPLIQPLNAQAIDQNSAWQFVDKMIYERIQGIDPNYAKNFQIQLPSASLYANWDDQNYGQYELQKIADVLPPWSPTWTPTDKSFAQAYGYFVDSIKIPAGPAVDPAVLKKREDELAAASLALQKIEDAVDLEWAKFDKGQKSKPLPYRWGYGTWYRNRAADRVNPKARARDDAFKAWFNLLDPNNQSTKLVQNYKNYRKINVQISGQPGVSEERYGYDASVVDLQTVAKIGESRFTAKPPSPEQTWTFDKSKGRRHEEQESWGAGASYGMFFSGSASGSRHAIDLNAANTHVTYSAYAFAIIPISRADWYSGVLVDQFACGPFKDGAPVNSASLFGENGRLNLVPVAALVAYRPSIEAKLTTTDYHFVHEEHTAGGSVSIGPFSFGGSHSFSSETVTWDEPKSTVTVSNNQAVPPPPQVIAIISRKLGRKCP